MSSRAVCGVVIARNQNKHISTADSLRRLQVEAKVVVGNLDPYRLRDLVGAECFGPELNQRLDAMRRPGTTMKVAGPVSRARCSRKQCMHADTLSRRSLALAYQSVPRMMDTTSAGCKMKVVQHDDAFCHQAGQGSPGQGVWLTRLGGL